MGNRVAVALRVSFAAIGLTLLAAGIAGGEPDEVMRKAIYVCLECIGIG